MNKSITTAAPEAQAAPSQNFLRRVDREYVAEVGQNLSLSPFQQRLARHLYIKISADLERLEIKRSATSFKKDDPPITWANVNMAKLAVDAVARVELELDAQIPNHIHVIPYLNARTRKYDVDLRVGYLGKLHIHSTFGQPKPLSVRCQLVHESDTFRYGTSPEGIAWYEYEQLSPFNPGEVIGGFGYIAYDEPRRNQVVIVEHREFEKAMKASKATEFWGGDQTVWKNGQKAGTEFDLKYRKEMQYKTVVTRVAARIQLNPATMARFEAALDAQSMDEIEEKVLMDAAQNANRDVIDIGTFAATPEPVAESERVETLGNLELSPDY